MALTDIRTRAMASLTHHLVTTARPVLTGNPMLQELLPRLDALQADFETFEAGPMARKAEVAALSAKAAELDTQHDGGLDRCFRYLSVVAELYPTPLAQRIEALRDKLMPHGLGGKNLSYQEEGAAAAAAKAQLTADDRALLTRISPADVDMAAQMDGWIEAGLALREMDAARATQAEMPYAGPSSSALRGRWHRMVSALRALSVLVDLSEADQALLFAKIDEESARRA